MDLQGFPMSGPIEKKGRDIRIPIDKNVDRAVGLVSSSHENLKSTETVYFVSAMHPMSKML